MQHRRLADFSHAELTQMADSHQDAAFRYAFRKVPHAKNEGGYFEMVTGLPDPFGNMMFGLDIEPAEERVSSATAKVKSLNVPALWWVGPCTKPDDLGDLLTSHGWDGPNPVPAMAIDLEGFNAPSAPMGFELRKVQSKEEVDEWTRICAEGSSLLIEVAQLMNPEAGGPFRAYTGFLDGQPVGTTALFTDQGIAGIYCVCTLPSHRGRGVGSALTSVPLCIAKGEGYRTGTLQASKMGYPIYKKLGFQDVCELSLYVMKPT